MRNLEERVIAGFLDGGVKSFRTYGQGMSAGDFADPRCRKLYERMESLAREGKEYDLVGITHEMQGTEGINAEYLLYIAEQSMDINMPAAIQSLLAARFRDRAYNLTKDHMDITAGELAEKMQSEIWTYHSGLPTEWNRQQAFQRMLDSIEYDMTHGIEFTTGLKDLDKMIGGFYRAEVTFIGARPSVGKTALAINISMHLLKHGKNVLYIDLESGDEPMMERFVCLDTRIPLISIRRRSLSPGQLAKVIQSAAGLSKLPLTINDRASQTPGQIHNQALALGADIIIVDYLNLQVRNSEQEVGQLGDMMMGYNTIAKELNIPVIVLGQLNRKLEDRNDKRPMMSDIRGSGKIEEFSTNIILQHYGFRYDDNSPEFEQTLFVVKQKHGPVGPVRLYWNSSMIKFGDITNGG